MTDYYIGIDLGGTNIGAGVVREDGTPEAFHTLRTPKGAPAPDVIRTMRRAAELALADCSRTLSDIRAVGVGSPGIVNPATGIVVFATNLPFDQYPVASALSDAMHGLPVYTLNDANAAAFGEFKAGSGRGTHSMVALTLGTGIGSGVVLEGDAMLDSRVASAEFGHMIIHRHGRPCLCGNAGCFEMYASATGLKMTTREYMLRNPDSAMWARCDGDIERVNGRTAFEAMRAGDRAGTAVVEDFVDALAIGVTNIINIIQPDLISLGGGVSNEGEAILAPLRAKVDAMSLSRFRRHAVLLKQAELGSSAGIIGSALYAAGRLHADC